MELAGAVAIVTGGSGGLGGRICHALAGAGSNVAVLYHENQPRAEIVAAELRELGVASDAFRCDVSDPESVESMVSSVLDRFGKVDILVNDAGYNKWIPFADLDALTNEDWSKLIGVNLTGPMQCIRAVAGPMRRQGRGRIVSVSSIAGVRPTGSSIAYAVAKAGLVHLTKCMAVGLAPEVLVNCVAPGYLEGTRMSENLTPPYRQAAIDRSLLKRAADKDDVADQVVAFCRTDSVTGQTLVIDSGRMFT